MQYRLRTLVIVLALAPPIAAKAWYAVQDALARYSDHLSVDGWKPCTEFRIEIVYPVQAGDLPTERD
jgi:hypothetical protein